jgi:hypothetical protein
MLLARIIKSVSPKELTKLRAELHLPERSRSLFETIATNPNTINSDILCKRFKVTKNNLYRLSSEIADDCIKVLAPAHEFPKPEFYRSRFIFEPFVTEIARTERRLLHEDRESLESFYEYAFESLLGFPINTMDFKLIESYMRKFHAAKNDPPPDHDLYLQMKLVFSHIAALPRYKKMTVKEMEHRSKELIAPYIPTAEISTNPWAVFYYYMALWKAETFSNVRRKRRIEFIELAHETIVKHPDQFKAQVKTSNEQLLAFEKATTGIDIDQAYELFSHADEGQTPNSSRNALFLQRFFRICMLAKRFDKARTIVDRIIPYQLIQTQGLLYRAILNIAEHRLDEVEADVAQVRLQNIDDNFFLPHEMEVRAIETILAFKRNDLELADTLVSRNLKWMQKRRYGLSQSPWPYYYQTIRAAITYRLTGELPKPLLWEHYKEFCTYAQLHSILLEEEAAKIFSQAKNITSITSEASDIGITKEYRSKTSILTKKRDIARRVPSLQQ